MRPKHIHLLILTTLCVSARAEEVVTVWLKTPPDVVAEIQKSAKDQAVWDIAHDSIKVIGFGLPIGDESGSYEKLLRKYHLTDENLGCVVNERDEIKMRAYREVVDAELDRKFGKDFWKRFDAELKSMRSEPNKPLQPIARTDRAPAER